MAEVGSRGAYGGSQQGAFKHPCRPGLKGPPRGVLEVLLAFGKLCRGRGDSQIPRRSRGHPAMSVPLQHLALGPHVLPHGLWICPHCHSSNQGLLRTPRGLPGESPPAADPGSSVPRRCPLWAGSQLPLRSAGRSLEQRQGTQSSGGDAVLSQQRDRMQSWAPGNVPLVRAAPVHIGFSRTFQEV